MLSDTAVWAMIRKWRLARLFALGNILGFASENILEKAGKGDRGFPELPDGVLTEAERVQKVVERMPAEMRSAFEARELGIIRGERDKRMPHKARALILGISYETYRIRNNAAHEFLRRELEEIAFDRSACF